MTLNYGKKVLIMKANFNLKDVKVKGIEIGNVEVAVEMNLEEMVELSRQRKELLENIPKMLDLAFAAFNSIDSVATKRHKSPESDFDLGSFK